MVKHSYLLKIFMLIIYEVLEIFHVFNFRGTRVPTKIINLEHFPIYDNLQDTLNLSVTKVIVYSVNHKP